MKTKAQKLIKSPKASSLEELKQKYFSMSKDTPGRKMLWMLIRRQDPKFKG